MAEEKIRPGNNEDTLYLVTNIVVAYVRNNIVQSSQIGPVIRSVYEALANMHSGDAADIGSTGLHPAVPVRKSITPDYLICLEDGRHLKMLKRYLRSQYKMTPDQYRAKWGLPADYPMVAPNYARQRSDFAKKIGLGKN